MATNKEYIVKKEGEELQALKTLVSAKKLADAEGAEVYCDGECIYSPTTESDPTGAMEADITSVETETGHVPDETKPDPVKVEQAPADAGPASVEKKVAQASERKHTGEAKSGTYELLTLMNIRIAPSLNAEKRGTAKAGTTVKVRQIKDDWMYLADGTYILFGNGRFARKM